MTNVVPFRKEHVGNLSDLDNDLTKQVRALINGKVRDTVFKREITMKQIALRANLATSTVSRLAYYETTRPTWRTIIAIAEVLDIITEIGELMVAYGRKGGK